MKKNGRRGISSIIGSIFVVLITVAGLATTVSVVQQQQRVTTAMTQETNKYLDSLNEKIEISQTRINNDKLNLTLSNAGDSLAHVKSIYIVNETAAPKEQYRYDVDFLVDGRAAITNVGQALPFVANNATSYTIRAVTESGNSDSSVYHPLALSSLPLSLSVIPPTITTGENVTLLYTITNNLASSEPLTISPTISSSAACDITQVCSATKLSSGPAEVVISQNGFVIVKETYKIEGPPNTIVSFNASFAEAKTGNYVIEKASVIVVVSTLDVTTGTATAPDIYLILPGPFGDSDWHGLWGTVVVNPTSSPMTVSRVLMSVFTAAHQGDVVMEEGCDDTAISPNDEQEWDCPHDSQIQWKDLENPETLQPGESKSFLVRVQPDDLGVSQEPGATVTATVYTDIGIFTKAGYTTAIRRADAPLGNVYLTDTTSESAENSNHMLGHLNDLSPGTNTTFYVAMADLDRNENTEINAGARLIINVPPGFGNVTIVSSNLFNTPAVTVRADGTTQIIGVTTGGTGDNDDDEEAKVIAFAAITPSPSEDSTYIMYAFIDGVTNGSTPISAGALAEIALQVDGGG